MDRRNVGAAQVIRANSRDLPLADDSVDLVVTSPPYFALRSYQDGGEHYAGQIGDEPTPAEFIDSLLEVTRECVRVLKPSGSLWVNLGDKYSRGKTGADNLTPGSRGAEFIATRQHHRMRGAEDSGGVPPKSLIGIPWRYALRCIDELGLILRAEVIWSKPNGLPESVTDRVRRSHEQWFHFTLEPRYFSAVDEIREEHITTGPWGDKRGAGYDRGASGHMNGDKPHPLGKLPGSVWTVPTEPLHVPDHLGIDHFAAFPTEWPRRIIQGWSPAGVCVECGEGVRRPVRLRLAAVQRTVRRLAPHGHRRAHDTLGRHRPRGSSVVEPPDRRAGPLLARWGVRLMARDHARLLVSIWDDEPPFASVYEAQKKRVAQAEARHAHMLSNTNSQGEHLYRVTSGGNIVRTKPITQGMKRRILKRDGHACVECGATEWLEVAHIEPYRINGNNADDNLRTLCHDCHAKEGN